MNSAFKKNLKKLLKINILAITLMICAIAVNSSYFLEIKDLPEKNFVNISMTRYITNCSNRNSLDQDADCQEETVIFKAFASGMAIKSDGEFSYILTAEHFCNPIDISDTGHTSSDQSQDFLITNHVGESFLADMVYSDSNLDLCIIRSKIKIDEVIDISLKIPKLGERVYSLSAPQGMKENKVTFHFEGSFSGCTDTDLCYFTIPATSGSSGSLVLNKEGNIIGMIQMTLIGFENISMGVGSRTIRLFLNEASDETGIQF
jgi:hypothetical protein